MDWLREQAGLTNPAEQTDGAGVTGQAPDPGGGPMETPAMIEKQFEAEIASGNMSAARQQMLTSVLRDLRATLERSGGGIGDASAAADTHSVHEINHPGVGSQIGQLR